MPPVNIDQAAIAHAHAAIGAAGLTMVVGRHLTNADGVQDTEYSLALRGADRLAIEQDGHVRLH